MPGCQRIPQRRHVELVANSETGNMGLKKGPGLHALSRSLCHEVCPVRDCSAPVVPRQEEISGAATGNVGIQPQKLSKFRILAINLPLRGDLFARYSQHLYASIGSY